MATNINYEENMVGWTGEDKMIKENICEGWIESETGSVIYELACEKK